MKIWIEIEDDGMKSTYEFEGKISQERIIDFLKAAGVFSESEEAARKSSAPSPSPTPQCKYDNGRTLRDRLETFIRYEFSDTWFSSNDLRLRYETVCDDINLSTVSTYLSRMYNDGLLERQGNRNQRQYRLISEDNPSEMGYSHSEAEEKAGWAGKP